MVAAHVQAEERGVRLVTFPFHMQQRSARRRELSVLAKQLVFISNPQKVTFAPVVAGLASCEQTSI